MINKNSKIYIAGHNGMVGRACWKLLKLNGFNNLIGNNSKDLDLKNFDTTKNFLKNESPEIIINAAAKVGGIHANNIYPYEFLMENMLIQNNLLKSSHELNIEKFIFLGSSCIYPKLCKQPIKEEYLLTGSLEPTNQWYAIAKISGVKLVDSLRKQFNAKYVSLMPTNLYGPNDNFDLETSHVLPALIRKFHEAKINNAKNVVVWGSGLPMREFLHVNDLAEAILFFINNDNFESIYNVGYGSDISIKDLALLIKSIINYKGKIIFDKSKPDGTPRKLIDSTKINKLGWQPKISLQDGIKNTYNWYLNNVKN